MFEFEEKLQNLFIDSINGLKMAMKNSIKEKGITLSPLYFIILKNIQDLENCTAHTLAEVTQRDKGQITRLIKELVELKLVIKAPNPNDKRSQFLKLTEKGFKSFNELQQADCKTIQKMMSGISNEDMENFLMIGEKMISNLKDHNNSSANNLLSR